MKSIVKFLGVSSCCLVGSVAAANAEPKVLADADLDRIAAGVDLFELDVGNPFHFGGIPAADRIYCAAIGCRPGEPGYPNPGSPPTGPVPTEPPGCETGACLPGFPFPSRPLPGIGEPFLPAFPGFAEPLFPGLF